MHVCAYVVSMVIPKQVCVVLRKRVPILYLHSYLVCEPTKGDICGSSEELSIEDWRIQGKNAACEGQSVVLTYLSM